MDWVKRNLYFLVGSAVAVVLLGLAGYYCYSKWQLNGDNGQKLQAGYAELNRLSMENPNPGNPKINNIENARRERQEVLALIRKERKFFSPIRPLPDLPEVTDQDFAAALRRTMDSLREEARQTGVGLPPDYYFSFGAQKQLVRFASGSPPLLAQQLGDINAICHVLFRAKVNSLENIRRVPVSADDANGPQSDYVSSAIVTNNLAVMTPYDVTFQCFSGELAAVLTGLANEPHGFIIKTVNVASGAAAQQLDQTGGYPYAPGAPTGYPPPQTPEGYPPGGYPPGGYPTGGYQPGGYPGAGAAAPAQFTKGGLPIVLDEKPLRVTLRLVVVRLLPNA